MSAHLSDTVLNAFIQKFSDQGNSCGFTLPLVFPNGSPAVVYAHKNTRDQIILSDYGLNVRHFEESVCVENFDAIDKIKYFCKMYESISVQDGCLVAETSIKQLDFTVIEYTELLGKLINYQYKSRSHQAIDEILDSIRVVLERKFHSIEVSPKLAGRSGEKYPFNFSHNSTFIDYIQADKNKTNYQLRKMIDTQNLNDNVSFNIIIDDTENDKYKAEQAILSDYAVVQPLSKFLRH
ncbi:MULTISPECIES: hypothetical protein [Acinetobacter]|uniref:hypothetical protein n=1 Tax=Acinetobacter TaxID=469 RepID=UPI0002CFD47A|nr:MULTISPECIES: hypothetical protein [Acinetobacter calcoaceticus/baumannii complex]ENW64327.1 hypothetical protein F914_01248 [Acinetobacter baumannii NIPH 290]MCA4085018.1 hypothetical protein [Acinetobacter baumannii]MCI2319136.1 hypothetical protein [Acinetobacter baumannii]MDP7923964.1 hypothetical protein [Acinetobacter baumannii]